MKKIAVTGNVSSGKSSVCSLLQKEGAYYLSTDQIVHDLLVPSTNLGKQLLQLLGKETLVNGQFSRELIAKKVFEHPKILTKLEKLLHPLVLDKIAQLYEQAKKEGSYPLFVVEMPLLYEIGEEHSYDCVVMVSCKENIAKNRWKQQGKSSFDFENRSQRMLPLEVKEKKANFIIKNNEGKEQLSQQVKQLYQQLTQL